MRAGRKAQAAMEATALMVDAVSKLTGLVTDLNDRQVSLTNSVGSLAGHFEIALIVEGVILNTLVELCDQADRTDLLEKIKESLAMVEEAMAAASHREGGPDL